MTDNKPCPFCGASTIDVRPAGPDWREAYCMGCSASAPDVRLGADPMETRDRAIAEWNRRAA